MIVILTDSLHFPQSCRFFQEILCCLQQEESCSPQVLHFLRRNLHIFQGMLLVLRSEHDNCCFSHALQDFCYVWSWTMSQYHRFFSKVRNTNLAQDRYTLWEIVHVAHESATLESFRNVSFKDILNETCANHNAHLPESCSLQRMLHSMFESSNKVSSCLVCNRSSCILKLQVLRVLEGILHHSKTYFSLSQEFCLFKAFGINSAICTWKTAT